MPIENIVGAGLVGAAGYYLGAHMALTPRGALVVHLVSGILALVILARPFMR